MSIVALTATILAVSTAHAAVGPVLVAKTRWGDTNLPPGGVGQFSVHVRNVGDTKAAAQPVTIENELPEGVTATEIVGELAPLCSGVGTDTVSCTLPGFLASARLPAPGRTPSILAAMPTGQLPAGLFIDVAIDPSAAGTGTNVVSVTGGGSPPASDIDPVNFDATPASFGLVPGSFLTDSFDGRFPFGGLERTAGAHPSELRVNFDLTQETGFDDEGEFAEFTHYTGPKGRVKNVEVTLPRGFLGNPEATPKCEQEDFAGQGSTGNSTACPPDTQVGYLNIPFGNGKHSFGYGGMDASSLSRVAIYNLVPPKGQAADFGFNAGTFVQGHIYPTLDPAQNYAIKTLTPEISDMLAVRGAEVTFWGVPADPIHDNDRYYSKAQGDPAVALGAPFGSAPIRPFLSNPTDCGVDNGGGRIRVDSWNEPGSWSPIEEHGDHLNVEGCDDPRFRFRPQISLQPTSRAAGGPTGLDVHLEVPQRNDEVDDANHLYAENGDVQAIPTPPMKKAVVTFPEGMTISPSAAQGLGNCSPEQIGLGTNKPVTCPDSSQYGTLTLHTPILPKNAQPEGWIYIAKQNENPYNNFLSLYLVIQEPDRGILVKIPAKAELDPLTGQIKTTFDDLPQFPVSDMQLTFKGGVRAALVNPSTCGEKTIRAEFFSWHDPATPHVVDNRYAVTNKPDGSPCVNHLSERPFQPDLEAGMLTNSAGTYSPFVFRLTRSDDDQEFSQLDVTNPEGLLAKIAGMSECSEASIAQAQASERTGAAERLFPSCPATSQLGTTEVGAGVGVPLTFVPGKTYLAGPYKGAPLSMVVITPALVGPYDLGVIAVRSAIHVDAESAQVTVKSDPFPQIFKGIPVRIRDIRVKVDRPQTTINPTSCERLSVTARVTGTGGDVNTPADDTTAELSERFQAADCASLPFKPRLGFKFSGGTKRGDFPALRATLRARTGDANIARTTVVLPRSTFIEQGHIRTVCTRVQFASNRCPAGSVYGKARAVSPLFDEPLEGPAYLRSNGGERVLPDLVVLLDGKIEVVLAGFIDSVNQRVRNTFNVIPDAPVTSFTLQMQGGGKGLLVNSRSLCAAPSLASVRMLAHNGKTLRTNPKVGVKCRGKRAKR